MSTQGRKANRTGNTLESTIVAVMESKGFQTVAHRQWLKNPQAYEGELLLRHVPYETIYQHKGKSEFVLQSAQKGLRVRVECKWQQTAGSVDEKFPYLYLNCLQMPEEKIIIVVDGGGAKDGAVSWLRHACQHRLFLPADSNKQIQTMSLTEFLIWANNTFR